MYPYVAFVSSAKDEGANAEARELVRRFRQFHQEWALLDDDNGLSVFHSLSAGRFFEPVLLPAKNGIVLLSFP
jgi:hypothetical protein